MYDEHSTLAVAIERLAENMQRIDERHEKSVERQEERHEKILNKVENVQNDVNKFVVLFEKLAQMEKRHEDSNQRVHFRITENEKKIEKIEQTQNTTGCIVFREMQKEREATIKQLEKDKANIEASIKEMQDRPKKRYEVVVTEIIKYSTIFVLGAIALKLGISGIK